MNILHYLDGQEAQKLKKAYRKGDMLHHENDRCEGVYFLLKGNVEVVSSSLSGSKILYNTLSEGDMFGNNLLFSSEPFYRGDVVAKQDCELIFLTKTKLLSLLTKDQAFLSEFLKVQCDFGKSLNAKIKLLSFDAAEERLHYLFFLNKGVIHFQSISSLAEGLCLKRETLSRLISRLEKEGSIQKEGHILRELS